MEQEKEKRVSFCLLLTYITPDIHRKRKEKEWALKWGMVGFEDEEAVRVEFLGETRPSLEK